MEGFSKSVREIPHTAKNRKFYDLLLIKMRFNSLECGVIFAGRQFGNGVDPRDRGLSSLIENLSFLEIVCLYESDLFLRQPCLCT